ncbi:hypothetical protein SAMN05421878_102105 [Actinobaculum suis]|uniref:Uncharacterized protein n=1 Tax=Actinobaculum suis TaxID=1657 RepID=A0A1G7A719_9ACTO|nr:hypothetical protein SAMN05421878_102105 [Actinobaculum suis]
MVQVMACCHGTDQYLTLQNLAGTENRYRKAGGENLLPPPHGHEEANDEHTETNEEISLPDPGNGECQAGNVGHHNKDQAYDH